MVSTASIQYRLSAFSIHGYSTAPIRWVDFLTHLTQGCCSSTQAGDSDGPASSAAAPTLHQPPSTAALNSTVSPLASTVSRAPVSRPLQTTPTPHSQSPSRSSTPLRHPPSSLHSNLPSHERYNNSLALPQRWTCTARSWTPSQLFRERADFFDTRVTGRPEIWGALQNVCELARSGDVATAQGILDAVGVTLPTGNLVDGCYDEAGNLYRLPEVVVSDPTNIAREREGSAGVKHEGGRNSHNIDGDTMIGLPESKGVATALEEKVSKQEEGKLEEEEDKEAMDRRREEKGKANERDAIQVRCRLSDRGGPDVVVTLEKTHHVSTLARRVQVEAHVSPLLTVRMAYLGKILNEHETLKAQGWKEGHVINALVVGDIPANT